MLKSILQNLRAVLPLGIVLAVNANLQAGEASGATSGKSPIAEAAVAPAEKSIYDRIWSVTKLYADKDNPLIQDISLSGRAQFDFFNINSDEGNESDWETRRLRAGAKIKFFKKWTLHGEVDFASQKLDDTSYRRMTDALLSYAYSDALVFTVGKHSAKFTLDGGTSSKELITIDRSNLANNLWFTEEYAPGVSVGGQVKNWQYFLGWFTSDGNPEFGSFSAGTYLLSSLGYDFAEALQCDEALLRADYVYQTPDDANSATRPFEHIGSVNFNYAKGNFGLGADVTGGVGYGKQGDILAFQIMPSYYLTKKLQVVLRYTHMDGDDNSIRFARYESRVVSGKGDTYDEIYAGVNYYLYGHKLKWQTGVQYASMGDSTNSGGKYDGFGLVSGIRISW